MGVAADPSEALASPRGFPCLAFRPQHIGQSIAGLRLLQCLEPRLELSGKLIELGSLACLQSVNEVEQRLVGPCGQQYQLDG